jgi:hydrogenase/urease accessory protein HupE
VVERYVKAGIEHIFLGYDHVAFLIAIVLWARRLWPVIKIVTAFTVAHSITLSLAALQIVVIPSAIVEPAIAARSSTSPSRTSFRATSTSAGTTPSLSG